MLDCIIQIQQHNQDYQHIDFVLLGCINFNLDPAMLCFYVRNEVAIEPYSPLMMASLFLRLFIINPFLLHHILSTLRH